MRCAYERRMRNILFIIVIIIPTLPFHKKNKNINVKLKRDMKEKFSIINKNSEFKKKRFILLNLQLIF